MKMVSIRKIAIYGNGEHEFNIKGVDDKFLREVMILRTLYHNKSSGFVLENIDERVTKVRNEQVEPFTMF